MYSENEISNLDLKLRLFKEWLENGGIETIWDIDLINDIGKVDIGHDGKADPKTISSSLNACMNAMLCSHLSPPTFSATHISEYSSTLQKSTCFDQINIDTEQHFNEIYNEYKSKTSILFRGQGEAKWRLYSKLQRHWIKDEIYKLELRYPVFVEKLIKKGREVYGKNIQNILNSKNVEYINGIAILSFLQHHDCPTPLLDWTYKFQNALYFALDGLSQNQGSIEIENYFSIYYIEEKYLEGGNLLQIMNEGLIQIEEEKLIKEISKRANTPELQKKMEEHFKVSQFFDRKKIMESDLINSFLNINNLFHDSISYFSDKDMGQGIHFSLNNSKNILNQQGVFMWNSHPTKPLEMIGKEYFEEDKTKEESEKYKLCHCFNINKKLENYIRKRLNEDGITKDFIYPSSNINAFHVFEATLKNLEQNSNI